MPPVTTANDSSSVSPDCIQRLRTDFSSFVPTRRPMLRCPLACSKDWQKTCRTGQLLPARYVLRQIPPQAGGCRFLCRQKDDDRGSNDSRRADSSRSAVCGQRGPHFPVHRHNRTRSSRESVRLCGPADQEQRDPYGILRRRRLRLCQPISEGEMVAGAAGSHLLLRPHFQKIGNRKLLKSAVRRNEWPWLTDERRESRISGGPDFRW